MCEKVTLHFLGCRLLRGGQRPNGKGTRTFVVESGHLMSHNWVSKVCVALKILHAITLMKVKFDMLCCFLVLKCLSSNRATHQMSYG